MKNSRKFVVLFSGIVLISAGVYSIHAYKSSMHLQEHGKAVSMDQHAMMGDMAGMSHSEKDGHSPDDSEAYTQSTEGLPNALESAVVLLKDGDIYDLVMAPVKKTVDGKEVRLLAYNGMLPGPRIEVEQGAKVTVNVTNSIGSPTSLHSHGLRLDASEDGVARDAASTIEDGETLAYRLSFPDTGVFWYHPHLREDYQQDLGLFGNFVVRNAKEEQPREEQFIFLDDFLLNTQGAVSYTEGRINHALMGRFGNTLLTNWETSPKYTVEQGNRVRLYFTNGANTRTFRLEMPDAVMKRVGADASHYERTEIVANQVIAPSERYTIDILFPQAGTYTLRNTTPSGSSELAQFTVQGGASSEEVSAFSQSVENTQVLQEMLPIRAMFDQAPAKNITFGLDMEGMNMDMHGGHGGISSTSPSPIEWDDDMNAMNSMSTSDNTHWKITDTDTKKTNGDIDWRFSKGDLVKIRVTNPADSMHPMQHPFHMHGQRFAIVSVNGVQQENLAWKDTVLVPAGESIDIVVDMSNPGTWMAHCHISEHLHSGMMFSYTVE